MTATETVEATDPPADPLPVDPPAAPLPDDHGDAHPLRAHLAPHAAVGALVVAAGAVRIAADLSGEESALALWTAATAFVLAVVAATLVRRRVFDKAARRRALAFVAVSAGWLSTVAATGLSVGAVGVLMALGFGLSMHWWRVRPVPAGVDAPLPTIDSVPLSEDEIERYARRWATNVAGAKRSLPGTYLTDPEVIRAGVRYTLMLVPGQHTLELVEGLMSRLRGGLELHRTQQLMIEAHPELSEPHLRVTIVTRSPVKGGVLWPGPAAFDPATGRVRIGPYADGEGTATWRAYTSDRLWSGFIQGGTGSGKSRLIDSIAMSLASSETHPTVVWYADGQGGASSPLLMRHSDLFAGTPERVLAMLRAMELVVLLRQRENVEHELEGFTPTPERPGLQGIIDECHKVLQKAENPLYAEETQRIAATIAREGGKVGVALLLASQEPTLGAFGGAGTAYCEPLRSSLLTGNGVMLAGDDPNAKEIFSIAANPKKFPAGGGYGFVAKPADGERAALFRSYFLDNHLKKTWPDRIVWRSLDGLPAGDVIPNYARRERSFTDRKRVVNGTPLSPPSATVPASAPAGVVGGGQALDLFGAKAFPSWAQFAAQIPATPRPAQPQPASLSDGQLKVLDAFDAGHRSPKPIAHATGYSVRQVHNLLEELVATGHVVKGAKQGQYARTRIAA